MDELIHTIGQTIIDTYNKAAEEAARIVPKELADKDIQIGNLNSRILALEAECRDRKAREEALTSKIAGYERSIQQYAEENAARSKKADSYAVVIRQQEDIIRQRNATVKELQEENRKWQVKVHTLTTDPLISNLQKKLTAAQNQVKSFCDTIEAQKLDIISMEGKIDELSKQPKIAQVVPTIQVGHVTWNAEEIQKMVDTNVKQAQEIERLRGIPQSADVIYVGQHPYDVAGINHLLSTIAQLRSEIQGMRSTVPIVKVDGQYMTAQQVEAMKKKLDELRADEPRKQAIAKRAESTLAATRRHIVAWRTRARDAEEQLKKYKDVEDFERRRDTMLSAESRVRNAEANAEHYRLRLNELTAEIRNLTKQVLDLSTKNTAITEDRDRWRGKAAELMNGCIPTKETLQELVNHFVQSTPRTVDCPDNCVVCRFVDPSQVKIEIGGEQYPACDVREAFAALGNVNKGLCVIDGVIYYYKDIVRMAADLISKQESIRVVTDTNDHITKELARLRPLEQENAELKRRVHTFEIEKKIRDGRAKANGIAASPVVATTEPNAMKPGVAYMTTPVGLLPVDSDGMRYLVDKLALYMSVNQELNKAVLDMADSVKKAIERT